MSNNEMALLGAFFVLIFCGFVSIYKAGAELRMAYVLGTIAAWLAAVYVGVIFTVKLFTG